MENLKSWIVTIRHMTEVRMFEEYKQSQAITQSTKPSNPKPKIKYTPKMPFQNGFVNEKAEILKAINVQNSDVIETAKSMLSNGRISQNLFDRIYNQLMLCI